MRDVRMRYSGTDEENPALKDWSADYASRDNLTFFREALAAIGREANGGLMAIGLVGSRDLPGVTLRQAQSVLRWDLRPSLWSHAFLIAQLVGPDDDVARVQVLEVPVHDRTGRFPRPERNGVSDGRLGLYGDRRVDANAALLVVRMNAEEVGRVAAQANAPNRDRARYDLWGTLGVWHSYVWSPGTRPNPLRDGVPIPASAFVEYTFESLRLDLAPGASERNSAPEHLWNAAKSWYPTFERLGHPIAGYYVVRDPGCAVLDADEIPEPPSTLDVPPRSTVAQRRSAPTEQRQLEDAT